MVAIAAIAAIAAFAACAAIAAIAAIVAIAAIAAIAAISAIAVSFCRSVPPEFLRSFLFLHCLILFDSDTNLCLKITFVVQRYRKSDL